MSTSSSAPTFHFTAHHNWRWMVRGAMEKLSYLTSGDAQHAVECASFKALPHSQRHTALRAQYSLFRVDALDGENDSVRAAVRITSPSLSFMDPKDILCRELAAVHAEQLMPRTLLIPCEMDEEERARFLSSLSLPSTPALLKAPLGSGGFGLYFVYSAFDIEEVLRAHQRRAEGDRKTLESVKASFEPYARHPLCWSLQALVSPRCCDVPPPLPGTLEEGVDLQQYCKNRRTQLRAYVVECAGELYLYEVCEVRCPLWGEDIDEVLREETERFADGERLRARGGRESTRVWADAVEEECCGRGAARPYNAQRVKQCTDRFLMRELDELRDCEQAVRDCVIAAFGRLKRRILQVREEGKESEGCTSMAIMGVDLLVAERDSNSDGATEVLIVEVNNNPAMPADKKRMSALYREHLVDLGLSLAVLALDRAGLAHPKWARYLERFQVIPDLL